MDTPKKYVIIFARDEQGNEIKYRFMLSISKPFSEKEAVLAKTINALEGIDALQIIGKYTADIMVGRAFDADKVVSTLTKILDSFLSDIITPKLVV